MHSTSDSWTWPSRLSRASRVLAVTSGVLLAIGAVAPSGAAFAGVAQSADSVTIVNDLGETTEITVDNSTPPVSPSAQGSGDIADPVGGISLDELDLVTPRVDATSPNQRNRSLEPGTVTPRVVIGTDNRTQVDVSVSPHTQIPLILFTNNEANYMCTGALVADRTVVTAGHCLFDTDGGGLQWSSQVAVLFSMQGTVYSFRCYPTTLSASTNWVNNQTNSDDWGVIQLACNAGSVAGHFGYRDSGTGAVSGSDWSVTGYPGDKVTSSGYSMWTHSGSLNSHSSTQVTYTIDTAGGQSGAPIWRLESGTACGNCVIGVHTAGSPTVGLNFGTRLTGGFKSTVDYIASL